MKAAAATSQYQQPPEHADIERSLIVSALLDGATIDEASSIVGPADFYRTANRILWQAILDVHGAGLPVGIDTVSLQLKESGKLAEVGGSVSLARLLDEVPAASSVEFIATKIKEAANWRRLLEITNKAAWAAKEGKVFSDTVAEVLREVEAIKRAGTTAKA
ncbi:MAG: DnaB-like helicase N-terminal domain-containing protein, partial [Desulfosarcinaceae bacterium]